MIIIPNEEDEAILYISTHVMNGMLEKCGLEMEVITHIVHPYC